MTLGWKVTWKSYLTLFDSRTVGSSDPPLSMEFSWQEYWSRLPFPSPGESSQHRDRTRYPTLKVDSLLSEPPGGLGWGNDFEAITQKVQATKETDTLLLLLSRFSHVRLCATPQTAAHQAPPSLGFSRQEHWSGFPFPSPMHESKKWKWSRSVVSDS